MSTTTVFQVFFIATKDGGKRIASKLKEASGVGFSFLPSYAPHGHSRTYENAWVSDPVEGDAHDRLTAAANDLLPNQTGQTYFEVHAGTV